MKINIKSGSPGAGSYKCMFYYWKLCWQCNVLSAEMENKNIKNILKKMKYTKIQVPWNKPHLLPLLD